MPQFTEEEAQRIFARAAERQHAASDSAPGFSLEELTEIGMAAGLSPEHIAAAVADVKAAPLTRDPDTTVVGVQTEIQRTRVVPGEISDEMWEVMVSRLRRTFKTKGITASVGRAREWTGTNSEGGLSNLHVVAAPVEGGTQITLETSRTDEARQIKWFPVVFAFLTAFFPLIGAAQGKLDEPAIWVFAALIAAMGTVGFLSTRHSFAKWSETRQREFDALLDQFDLLVRDPVATASPLSSSTPTSPLLDLNELASEPDARSDATRARTRA